MKKKLFSEQTIKNNIHKIYLILALLFGISFSVFLPFFNEPDGQYHYVVSTNIAGLSNDITKYGESSQWFGDQYGQQVKAYQAGDFFQKYYATPIRRVPISTLPRANTLPHKYTYNYLSHLIPAIGTWIGYHIYPSMGVMITMGRLFSMFVCSLSMFFIIRKIKVGKLFFAAVSLSPTIMNSFSSLSYDATSYVLSALIIVTAVNGFMAGRLSRGFILRSIGVILLSVLAVKTNLLLLLLLFPVVFIALWNKKKKTKQSKKKRIRIVSVIALSLLFLGLIAFYIISRSNNTGMGRIFYQLFINSTYNFQQGGFDVTTVLADPIWGIMPAWLTIVWFVMLVAIIFVEDNVITSKNISFSAGAIVLLNVLAVYYSYISGPFGMPQNRAGIMGYIPGVQGRYFTPFFLLFPVAMNNVYFERWKLKNYRFVFFASFLIICYSNASWLFNNLFWVFFIHT